MRSNRIGKASIIRKIIELSEIGLMADRPNNTNTFLEIGMIRQDRLIFIKEGTKLAFLS